MKSINEELIFRQAKPEDNIAEIAACLYQTDPYIYPSILSSCGEEWDRIITECFGKNQNLFHYKNLYVLEECGKIIGVICAVLGGERLRFAEDVTSYNIPDSVIRGYFMPLFEENINLRGYNIINLCILDGKRNLGYGRKLISNFINLFGKSDIWLDVLTDNMAAVKLYKSCGFQIVETRNGFGGGESDVLCHHCLRKGK